MSIQHYGESYLGQNYEVLFDDEELDYICTDMDVAGWDKVLAELKRRHPNDKIVEVNAV